MIIVLGVVFYLFYINSKNLPSYEQLSVYQPPIVTRFYASDGKLLEEYAKEHRLFLPISEIPDLVKNAFIAAEDKNFYNHPGVDFLGIVRAAIKNIIASSQGRKSLVGGSTITQQVVKNFLLTKEKSINRKIKEAILSFRISKSLPKDKILELYLNEIFLGARSYGVASAALNYFNKSVNNLNIEEAAFLAALPQAPSYYNPYKNHDRALARRNWVIERMHDEKMLNKADALNAVAAPIKLISRSKDDVVKADFFAEAVRQDIAEMYGEKSLYEGGLMIKTTLNPKLQTIAEKSMKNGLINYDQKHGYRGAYAKIQVTSTWFKEILQVKPPEIDIYPWKIAAILQINKNEIKIGFADESISKLNLEGSNWAILGRDLNKIFVLGDVILVNLNADKKTYDLKQIPKINGGMVAMDPHTGRVLAMVGGYSFDSSKFNRVTQAYRQPGSTFKPFVYLTALENNFTPASIFEDSPISLEQGPGMPLWRPKNFYNDFLGPLTLRRGLELSRNTITVRIAQAVGIKKVAEVAKRFGINHNPQPYYSMVLGAIETTLLRITNAYAIIANGGHKVTPQLVEKIQDRNGKLVFISDKRECINCELSLEESNALASEKIAYINNNQPYVTDPRSAFQLTSILEGVIQHTKTSLATRNLGKILAGKTGTSNGPKDVWFIGYSPDLVVGIYAGYDEPKLLGKNESGAMICQPIFVEFMKEALTDQPDKPFKMPDGLKLVKINYLTGEPTTSQYGSFYEFFKRKNYQDEAKFKLVEVETSPEPVQNTQANEDINDLLSLEEIEEDGIY